MDTASDDRREGDVRSESEAGRPADGDGPNAVLIHLTGSRRGATDPLAGETIDIGTAADADVHFPADRARAVGAQHARLVREREAYRLEAAAGASVRVNGEPVDRRLLASGDVLEIGLGGPMLRLRLGAPPGRAYKTMAELLADCVDCARYGGRHLPGRAWLFLRNLPRELLTQSSPASRAALFGLLAVSLLSVIGLGVQSWRLERRLDAEATRLGEIAAQVEIGESQALTADELRIIRARLEARLAEAEERVEALEAQGDAAQRTIAAAARSIVLLQGAYGFREPETDRPLRAVLGPGGQPVRDPFGYPLLSPDGEGPIAQGLFTGTGFVASEGGLLLTNRHVALPWEAEETALALIDRGWVPYMNRLIGYLPEEREPFEVELVLASETADVAVLRCSGITADVAPLRLSERPAQAGDEVLVLGYPTGVQALLARTDPGFVEQLATAGPFDFWEIARRLAEGGHIAPLATRGIVGQVTDARVVYDAETTSGGSGGPVLGLDQEVLAINAAILTEFGGSNLGVPAAAAMELLSRAEEIERSESVSGDSLPD